MKGVLKMAKRTTYELYDFLTSENDLSISATDLDNNTQVVISSNDSVRYMKRKYGTRQYSLLSGVNTPTPADAYGEFTLDFRMWVNNRQHNIDRMYQALFDYDYSPIENVDRYESETTNVDDVTAYGKTNTISETDTTTYGKTDTTTFGKTDTRNVTDTLRKTGTDTNLKTGAETHEIEKAGFNAPFTYTPDTRDTLGFTGRQDQHTLDLTDADTIADTNVQSGTESLATTGTDRLVKSGSDTLSGTDRSDIDTTRTLHVHGNIGVTTNTQLIDDELRVRMKSLAEMLLDNFINDYTFYS